MSPAGPLILPPMYGATGGITVLSNFCSSFSGPLGFHGFCPGFQCVGGGLSDLIRAILAASSNFFLSMPLSRRVPLRRFLSREVDRDLEE